MTTDNPSLKVSKAARTLGVNRVTLYDWFARGCPRGTVEEIAAWRQANVRNDRLEHDKRAEMGEALAQVVAPTDPGSLAPKKRAKKALSLSEKRLKADTEKIRAEVAYKLMRNAEKRKNLVSLAEVQLEAAELAIRIKERLLAAPDEMETRFPAETRAGNKADFEEFIRQLLLEISGWKILGEPMHARIKAAAESLA